VELEMKLSLNLLGLAVLLAMTATPSNAQTEPKIESAAPAVVQAFQSHDIVMLGEPHGNKQEYDWLRSDCRVCKSRGRHRDGVW
jgi:hypothetical protein